MLVRAYGTPKWVPVRGAQVAEGDFLEVVTTTPRVVCHFFHRDFERCKLLDQHLAVLARRYIDTRFIRLSAPVRARLDVETSFRNVTEAAGLASEMSLKLLDHHMAALTACTLTHALSACWHLCASLTRHTSR